MKLEGEIIDVDDMNDGADLPMSGADPFITIRPALEQGRPNAALRNYIVLPFIFLAVTLLGGMRIASADHAFLFLAPPLVCLVLAAMLMLLFVRAGLVSLGGWFDQEQPLTQSTANLLLLLTLFLGSIQVFNSVLPEAGMPYWILAFCFFWTLWTNLFADFNAARLLKSVTAMFFLGFVVKYLALSSLAAPDGGNWLQRLIQNPGREAFTWLLDLPHYAPATGYIQFFTLALFLIGLYLTPRTTRT